jgi:hypothetical protein
MRLLKVTIAFLAVLVVIAFCVRPHDETPVVSDPTFDEHGRIVSWPEFPGAARETNHYLDTMSRPAKPTFQPVFDDHGRLIALPGHENLIDDINIQRKLNGLIR